MSRMRRQGPKQSSAPSKVSIGFTFLPLIAENGKREITPEQTQVINTLRTRCPQMFTRCATTMREEGNERLYTSVKPLMKQLPNPEQLARVLTSNNLNMRVDVYRTGVGAQSTHFRLTSNDILKFMNGSPLQLCVLSDVANSRNNHGKLVFERTSAGQMGKIHYEISTEKDDQRFRLV